MTDAVDVRHWVWLAVALHPKRVDERRQRGGYHILHPSIEIEETSLVVSVTADGAVLNGRAIFHATINGMKNPWRLQFALRYAKTGAQWLIMHARYTSF